MGQTMSNIGQGFTDPKMWHGTGLIGTLTGLPMFKGGLGSPSWVKDHPETAASVAAALAAAFTGGGSLAALGSMGGEGAAGAAGAGAGLGAADAAEAGAGAWMGGAAGAGNAAGVLPGAASGAGGLLGMGTSGSMMGNGLAGIAGPSNFTAGLAGDAYLPGALGSSGTGTAGMGSQIGGAMNSMGPKVAANLGKSMMQSAFTPQPAQTPQRPYSMSQQQPVQSSAQSLAPVFGAQAGASQQAQLAQILAALKAQGQM